MDPSTILESLNFLTQYIEASDARCTALQQELDTIRRDTSTKDDLDAAKSRLGHLESENSALRQQTATLQDSLKLKNEPSDATAVSAADLTKIREMLREEQLRNEALSTKCARMEMRLKESAEIAAKEMRERVEGEKVLDQIRVELEESKKAAEPLAPVGEAVEEERAKEDDSGEANESAIATLRAKYRALKKNSSTIAEGLKAEVSSLETSLSDMKEKYKRVKSQRADWISAYNELAESNAQSTQIPDDVEEDDEIMEIDGDNVPENSEGLRAEVASLETSLSELKEKYKRVKSEKTDWKRAYREVADSLREESSTNAPSTRMPDDQEADDESSEDDGEVDTDDGDEDTDGTPDDIEENDESSEDGEEDADEEPATFENAAAETSVTGPPTMSAYRQHMTSQLLPVVVDRSKFSDLAIDKGLGFNLHSYLGQSQGSWIFLNHILYLPGRLVELSGLDLLVAFGPTNRYNRQSQKWVEGSDLAILDGATREVFMAKNKQIIYAGSYKCHDLRPVNPEGVNRPGSVSGSEIIDAALGIPRPSNYKEIIRKHFPDGNITIEAVGLRCVGFNHQLYESLRQRFEALDAKKKRKAEKQNEKGKGTKRRKVKGNN